MAAVERATPNSPTGNQLVIVFETEQDCNIKWHTIGSLSIWSTDAKQYDSLVWLKLCEADGILEKHSLLQYFLCCVSKEKPRPDIVIDNILSRHSLKCLMHVSMLSSALTLDQLIFISSYQGQTNWWNDRVVIPHKNGVFYFHQMPNKCIKFSKHGLINYSASWSIVVSLAF